MEFLVAMAIPAIGNGRPKLDFITFSAHELKGVVSRVVEVEWAKFTHFFLRDRAVFQKSATFNGLKSLPSSC